MISQECCYRVRLQPFTRVQQKHSDYNFIVIPITYTKQNWETNKDQVGTIMATSRFFWPKINIFFKLYIKRSGMIRRSFWYYFEGHWWSCVGGKTEKRFETQIIEVANVKMNDYSYIAISIISNEYDDHYV